MMDSLPLLLLYHVAGPILSFSLTYLFLVAVSGSSAIVVNDAQYQYTTSEASELCVPPPPRWSVLSQCGQHLKSAISSG